MAEEKPDDRGSLENQEDNFDEVFDQVADTPEPGDPEVI